MHDTADYGHDGLAPWLNMASLRPKGPRAWTLEGVLDCFTITLCRICRLLHVGKVLPLNIR